MKKIIDKIEEYMFKDEKKDIPSYAFFLLFFLVIIDFVIGGYTHHMDLKYITAIIICLIFCWIYIKYYFPAIIITFLIIGVIGIPNQFITYLTKYFKAEALFFIYFALILGSVLSYLFLLMYHDEKVKQKNKMVENVS